MTEYDGSTTKQESNHSEGVKMTEHLNVFTHPACNSWNHGYNGYNGYNGANQGITSSDLTMATNTILNGQQQAALESGHQNILQAVNNDARDNLLATCNLGDRLSTQVCSAESNIVNNIGSQAGSIRAEISESRLQSSNQFSNLQMQNANQFSALQLQNANDTFNLTRQMCDQSASTAAQFAALQLQNCKDQNALQMQIAQCCSETKEAIAAVAAAAVKDELDELRLQRALANAR